MKKNQHTKQDRTMMMKTRTTQEVAARFDELAQQEKWFEIQDELFSSDVTSSEPEGSPYFAPLQKANGKDAVRKKGESWVANVEEFHGANTTQPVIGGNYFAVGRDFDITVKGFGRIKIEQVMMYEVKHGQIISERFYY
jgi:hypothetical protein